MDSNEILMQIANLLRDNKDALLMETVSDTGCNCKGKTKKVFRCPAAFQINMLLNQLNSKGDLL